jgi:hypothetical protein
MSFQVGDDEGPLNTNGGQKQEAAADFPMMENEVTARSKLKDAGFDPDASLDAATTSNVYALEKATPMIHFCLKGDMPMCQYLLSKGASTTKTCRSRGVEYFPMYAAVLSGSLEMCKWLHVNGAQEDVRKKICVSYTPLCVAAANNKDELVRWFVLHGALCADDSTDIVETQMLLPMSSLYNRSALERLAKWAGTATQPIRNPSVLAFLCGTLPPKSNDDADSPCILQYYLSGQSGIRKRIAEFAGLYTKREVSIMRQVRDEVPSFIASRDRLH